MEQPDILGSSFECQCGNVHTVPTKHLFYQEDALDHLPAVARSVAKGFSFLVIADTRTFEVAGRMVYERLSSADTRMNRFIVPDVKGEWPSANETTRDLILNHTSPADLYIAVGSGVINDLVKWVACLRGKPYIVIATAASMNGYASANVAATIGQLKVLVEAEACRAVFAVPEIMMNAPCELTTSGLGDVLAKSVSAADWKLNQFLFNDYYCQFAVDLLKHLEPVYLKNPTGLRQKDPVSFQALFSALFYSGIAMTITGTSSPASGGEHLISHTLDMLASRDGNTHDFHGRQVGVSSILMAALYEQVMAIEKPEFRAVPPAIDREFWGLLSPVVAEEYDKKLPKMKQAAASLSQKDNWKRLKALLQPKLMQAETLKRCLVQAGGAHRFSDLRLNNKPLERDLFLAVVTHANQMRNRFTILDIATMLEIIPGRIDYLVDRWLTD